MLYFNIFRLDAFDFLLNWLNMINNNIQKSVCVI